jgi:hypothetical protein
MHETMHKILDTDAAWLAGLIDGEGCISVVRQVRPDRPSVRYWIQLRLQMTHFPTLERVQELTGIGKVHPRKSHVPEIGKQPWYWNVASREAADVLKAVLPYLVTKRIEAELAMEFWLLPRTFFPKGGAIPVTQAERERLYWAIKNEKKTEWGNRGYDALSLEH